MTTQQVIALIVISAFIAGLYAYAYFLGRKAGRAHHQRGLLFDFLSGDVSRTTIMGIPPQGSTSEGGHAQAQELIEVAPASLREDLIVDAQKTKSLCCEAAGILPPFSSPAEALIPHDKLREAAPADATLIAKSRPHAQPAEGYTHPSPVSCIVAAMDTTLAEQAGAYATSEQMAQAIETALQQAGFLMRDDAYQLLRDRLAELKELRRTAATLKRTIAELEERIMSYTGLAVTRADYVLLSNIAKTLHLTEKTWKAAPGTEPWCNRATQQMQDIQALAVRVHAQLRNTPASSDTAGEAA